MAGSHPKFSFLALLAMLAVWPDMAPAVEHGTPSGPLSLASATRPLKGERQIYLVQLNEAGALNYRGTKAGFAATKPSIGRKLDRTSGAVESYVKYLEESHDQLLINSGAPDSKLYSFRYALNGFSAQLTSDQVSRLKQSGAVARIWLDT